MRLSISLFAFTLFVSAGPKIQHVKPNIINSPQLNSYALLIGVNEYEQESLGNLSNPIQDITLLKAKLEEQYEFTVDTLQNPTRATIKDKLEELVLLLENRVLDPEGQLLIYLSGHGYYDKQWGTGYFLPADYSGEDPDATALPYDRWQKFINNLNSNHILVVIDACYSGTFVTKEQFRDGTDRDFKRPGELSDDEKLLHHHQNTQSRIFLASAAEEPSPDRSGFTAGIINALHREQKSKILTVEEVFADYLRRVQPPPVFDHFGDGQPTGTFLFIPENFEVNINQYERLLWDWAAKQSDLEAIDFFLSRYPEGSYVQDAINLRDFLTSTADTTATDHTTPLKTLYVRLGEKGDGSSWSNAFNDLQQALSKASPGTHIYVASGIYYPTTDGDRTKSFTLPKGVKVYGGFNGTESTVEERDLASNLTILSGNIGDKETNEDNSYSVVTSYDMDHSNLVDGFIIQDGYADGTAMGVDPTTFGGGWLNIVERESSGRIANCTFRNNHAREGGGLANVVLENATGKLVVEHCTFIQNSVDFDGGGIYNYGGGISTPIIRDCKFVGNEAMYGAGIFNDALFEEAVCRPYITDSYFSDNIALLRGSALYNNRTAGQIEPIIENNTFESNASTVGASFDETIAVQRDSSKSRIPIRTNGY